MSSNCVFHVIIYRSFQLCQDNGIILWLITESHIQIYDKFRQSCQRSWIWNPVQFHFPFPLVWNINIFITLNPIRHVVIFQDIWIIMLDEQSVSVRNSAMTSFYIIHIRTKVLNIVVNIDDIPSVIYFIGSVPIR